jgi:hypothetical protein
MHLQSLKTTALLCFCLKKLKNWHPGGIRTVTQVNAMTTAHSSGLNRFAVDFVGPLLHIYKCFACRRSIILWYMVERKKRHFSTFSKFRIIEPCVQVPVLQKWQICSNCLQMFVITFLLQPFTYLLHYTIFWRAIFLRKFREDTCQNRINETYKYLCRVGLIFRKFVIFSHICEKILQMHMCT